MDLGETVGNFLFSATFPNTFHPPRPSRSYNRYIDEPTVSSSARHRNSPQGHNPTGGGANVQDVVDHGRARREAELAAQHAARQLTPVHPTTSVESGVVFSSLGGHVSPRPYVTCGCPRISRVLVRCPITLPIYPLNHGLRAMKWRWRCWMWMMRHVLNTSP